MNTQRAIFLSYASEDTAAAQRICDALRAVGIEVWFDKSELRGGDAWDQKIRREIRTCALFIPVISRNTQARTEGYFRLEWHLADQRTHLMARSRPFLLPVSIDDTPELNAEVPESFAAVQWAHLPAGQSSPAFVELVTHLLALPEHAAPPQAAAEPAERSPEVRRYPAGLGRRTWLSIAILVLLIGGSAWWGVRKAEAPGNPL